MVVVLLLLTYPISVRVQQMSVTTLAEYSFIQMFFILFARVSITNRRNCVVRISSSHTLITGEFHYREKKKKKKVKTLFTISSIQFLLVLLERSNHLSTLQRSEQYIDDKIHSLLSFLSL